MSEFLIQGKTLANIADAIREKAGSADAMTPAEMAEAILGIQAGGGALEGAVIKYGIVTPAEDISGQLPLFEVSAVAFESVPDVLFFMYYPESTKRTESLTDGLLYWEVSFKHTVTNASSGKSRTVRLLRYGSTIYAPEISEGYSLDYRTATKNNMLHVPYNNSVVTFPAGERFYYLAIYNGEDMRGV